MTTDCLKSWGSCHKERLIILVDGGMMGTKIKAQSFDMKLGIWSSLQEEIITFGIFQSQMLVGSQMIIMEVGKKESCKQRRELLEVNHFWFWKAVTEERDEG